MTRLTWIPAIWRRKRAATPTPGFAMAPAASAPRLPRDEEEQDARIKNLAADTALKQQALDHGTIQIAINIASVVVALGGLGLAAASFYFSHRGVSHTHFIIYYATPNPHFLVLKPDD